MESLCFIIIYINEMYHRTWNVFGLSQSIQSWMNMVPQRMIVQPWSDEAKRDAE